MQRVWLAQSSIASFVIAISFCGYDASAQEPLVRETSGAFFDADRDTYFRFQHIEGRQLGDVMPFTMFGGTRYIHLDDGVILFDGQARLTNAGESGGSIGGVRRFLMDNSIVGAGLWFDINESSFDNTFQQIGTSLEWFRDVWSFRANGYFPVGNRRQTGQGGLRNGSTELRFLTNNIVFGGDIFRVEEIAMKGVELEAARSISDYDAEAYAGYYHFQAAGDQTHGYKLGVRGYVAETVAASVTVSSDPLFGTNVFGGVTLFFGGKGGNRPNTFRDKLTIPVQRNQLVAVNERMRRTGSDLVILTDPVSGLPIIVAHVDSSAVAGGDGTFENPLNSLNDIFNNSADGATTNGNIALAHSGSIFSGQVAALRNNQRFLGEGIPHTVNSTQLGTIGLPAANGPGTVPVISNAPSDAITLGAMGNEVSGFTISGGTRAIVRDTGATNTNINRLTIQNTTGDAIVITPSTATTINNVTFSNIGGMDIVLNAQDTTITNVTSTNAMGGSISLSNLTGTTTINNVNISGAGGFGGILLNNALNGSQINLTDVDVSGGNDGLSITNAQAGSTFTVNALDVTGAGGSSLRLNGNSGTFAFNDVDISNPIGVGIDIDGGNGNFTFTGPTSITNRGSTGIDIDNTTGNFQFGTTNVTGAGGIMAGIELANTGGMISFDSASVTGSGGDGVQAVNVNSLAIGTTGTNPGDGGTIQGVTGNGIFVRDSSVDIRFMNISNVSEVTDNRFSTTPVVPIDEDTGDGIRYELRTNINVSAVFQNNVVSNVADEGIQLDLNAGVIAANISSNQVTATNTGIRIQQSEAGGSTGTLIMRENIVASTTSGGGIQASANNQGDITITDLTSNVVTSGGTGISLARFGYDANILMGGIQPVSAGTTILGSATSRLTGRGFALDAASALIFDSLTVFNMNNDGIDYNSIINDLNLTINGGTIDVANDNPGFIGNTRNAIDIRTAGGSLTLNNLNINMNGVADSEAIFIQNVFVGGVMTPINLSGTNNTATGFTTFSEFDFIPAGSTNAQNFTGTIMFDMGNQLP